MLLALAVCIVQSSTWSPKVPGDADRGTLGWCVTGLADVDGDRVPDFAASGGIGALPVSIFSGANGAVLRTIEASEPALDVGVSLADPGDFDGDGRGDIAVGAKRNAAGFAAFVGVHSGADGKLLARFDGAAPGDGYGLTLVCADLDHDGKREFIVGAPRDRTAGENAGAVYVYSGATQRLTHLARGRFERGHFGAALALAGDIDRDGVDDVWIGAPGAREKMSDANCGEVVLLSGRNGRVLSTVAPSGDDASFAHSLAGLDDLDGDGVPELAAGARRQVQPQVTIGLVRIVSGASGRMLREFVARTNAETFAYALASVPDANGDGHRDLAVGVPDSFHGGTWGSVRLHASSDGVELFERYFDAEPILHGMGVSLAVTRDIDGDGIDDLIVGAPDGLLGGGVHVMRGSNNGTIGEIGGEAQWPHK